jgi:hypothetical protein
VLIVAVALFAAKVWHYWVAPPLVLGGLFLAISLAVGYMKKVSAHRPPPPKR